MGPIKPVSNKILPKPMADAGYVDIFASNVSSPVSGQSNESGYGLDQSGDMFSDMLSEGRFSKHPLFRDGGSVISHVGKDKPEECFNALQLLGLYQSQEIITSEPHKQLFVAAILNDNLREIRGFELCPDASTKKPNECLLTVRRERGFLAFDKADAAGLPADIAEWFWSLEGRIVKKSKYIEEMKSQVNHNEKAFQTFYHGERDGLPPEVYSNLYAWVALESGRILCVRGLPSPSETNDGMKTTFKVEIRGGAAYVSCTNRKALAGMPNLYLAYFLEPFITIRDVIPVAEEGVLDEEIVPETGSVPHEEAYALDSDATATGLVS